MKISMTSFSFIVACLLLLMAQPASAKMDSPIVRQDQVKTSENLSLKAKLIQKRIGKKVNKVLKKGEDKLGVGNDELIRWILIGLAVLIGLALLRFIGINLGGLLSLVLLILLVVLLFKYVL